MAAKKASLLPDDMDLDLDSARAKPGAAAPQPFIHEKPPVAVPLIASTPDVGRAIGLKEKAINMTLYMLPQDHRRLRQIAATEDTSLQTLLMDAVDMLLANRKQGPLTRWETRRRTR